MLKLNLNGCLKDGDDVNLVGFPFPLLPRPELSDQHGIEFDESETTF